MRVSVLIQVMDRDRTCYTGRNEALQWIEEYNSIRFRAVCQPLKSVWWVQCSKH
jgi:hypothetical protein